MLSPACLRERDLKAEIAHKLHIEFHFLSQPLPQNGMLNVVIVHKGIHEALNLKGAIEACQI